MIIAYSLILVLSTFAAFYSGFYFGHIKAENKPPDSMPYTPLQEYIGHKIDQVIEKVESKKKQDDENEPKGFFE